MSGDLPDGPAAGLFDFASEQWLQVAKPPFDAPLFSPKIVWNGSEYIVIGVRCGVAMGGDAVPDCEPGDVRAASYEPETDSWTPIEPPEVANSPEVFYIANSDLYAVFVASETLYIYEHASRTWRSTPSPLGPHEGCIIDNRLLIANSADGPIGVILDLESLEASPSVELANPVGVTSVSFACTANGILAVPPNLDPEAVRSQWIFTALGTWAPAPPFDAPGILVQSERRDALFAAWFTQPDAQPLLLDRSGDQAVVDVQEEILDLALSPSGRAVIVVESDTGERRVNAKVGG